MHSLIYPHRFDMPLGLSMAVSGDPVVSGAFSELTPVQREELAGRLAVSRADIAGLRGGELFHSLRPSDEQGGFR